MARPLRVEFAGALYHVTARGDGREDIYRADGDRHVFLDLLADVRGRFNWTIHAYFYFVRFVSHHRVGSCDRM